MQEIIVLAFKEAQHTFNGMNRWSIIEVTLCHQGLDSIHYLLKDNVESLVSLRGTVLVESPHVYIYTQVIMTSHPQECRKMKPHR